MIVKLEHFELGIKWKGTLDGMVRLLQRYLLGMGWLCQKNYVCYWEQGSTTNLPHSVHTVYYVLNMSRKQVGQCFFQVIYYLLSLMIFSFFLFFILWAGIMQLQMSGFLSFHPAISIFMKEHTLIEAGGMFAFYTSSLSFLQILCGRGPPSSGVSPHAWDCLSWPQARKCPCTGRWTYNAIRFWPFPSLRC